MGSFQIPTPLIFRWYSSRMATLPGGYHIVHFLASSIRLVFHFCAQFIFHTFLGQPAPVAHQEDLWVIKRSYYLFLFSWMTLGCHMWQLTYSNCHQSRRRPRSNLTKLSLFPLSLCTMKHFPFPYVIGKCFLTPDMERILTIPWVW